MRSWGLAARRSPATTRSRCACLLSFARLREALDGLLVDRPGGVGIVVHGFATVNAAFTLAPGAREPETAKSPSVPAGPVHGRLHALLAAPDVACCWQPQVPRPPGGWRRWSNGAGETRRDGGQDSGHATRGHWKAMPFTGHDAPAIHLVTR